MHQCWVKWLTHTKNASQKFSFKQTAQQLNSWQRLGLKSVRLLLSVLLILIGLTVLFFPLSLIGCWNNFTRVSLVGVSGTVSFGKISFSLSAWLNWMQMKLWRRVESNSTQLNSSERLNQLGSARLGWVKEIEDEIPSAKRRRKRRGRA